MTLSPVFIHLLFHNPCLPLILHLKERIGEKKRKKQEILATFSFPRAKEGEQQWGSSVLHKRELLSIALSMNYHHQKDQV